MAIVPIVERQWPAWGWTVEASENTSLRCICPNHCRASSPHHPDGEPQVARHASLAGGNRPGVLTMTRSLWQLLVEDLSDVTCDECFTVLEYYAEVLARGGADLLPAVMEHLQTCPNCAVQHREALRCLTASQSQRGTVPVSDLAESDGPDAED